jgi:hypothetical protein
MEWVASRKMGIGVSSMQIYRTRLTRLARRRRDRVRGMEIVMDGRRQVGSNDGGQRLQAGALYAAHAAEVGHQPIARLRAHAGNGQQIDSRSRISRRLRW